MRKSTLCPASPGPGHGQQSLRRLCTGAQGARPCVPGQCEALWHLSTLWGSLYSSLHVLRCLLPRVLQGLRHLLHFCSSRSSAPGLGVALGRSPVPRVSEDGLIFKDLPSLTTGACQAGLQVDLLTSGPSAPRWRPWAQLPPGRSRQQAGREGRLPPGA